MHIMHLDYAVPIRITSHSRTYLYGLWCNYRAHVDNKYLNYTYLSIMWITIHISVRNCNYQRYGNYQCSRSYQCCDCKVYSLHRAKNSHYATCADFTSLQIFDQSNCTNYFVKRANYLLGAKSNSHIDYGTST